MTADAVFQLANGVAPLAWMAMLIAPRSRFVQRTVLNGAFVAVLAAGYAAVLFTHFNFDGADFMSLEGVMSLLNDPWAMTAGWIHYLAFDLLAGTLVTRKGLALGFPRWALLPCQLGCFMLGPVGVVLFLLVGKVRGCTWQDLSLAR